MTFSGICLVTNNVRRLSAFYQTVLCAESDGDDEIHQNIHTQGASLAILKADGVTDAHTMEFRSAHTGNPNLALMITVDDCDAEFARLTALGIAVTDPPTVRPWGATNMRFRDPDGNFIVFRSFPAR
ncbi:MAG: VOC family protein [Oscillospiraceae bacterium]